jgi:hypothetical protein
VPPAPPRRLRSVHSPQASSPRLGSRSSARASPARTACLGVNVSWGMVRTLSGSSAGIR